MARNKWGSTRKLRSGRYQARYTGPDGIQYKAQTTFPDELAALGWLASIRQTIDLGTWQPPEIAPKVRKVPTVGEMVQLWLTQSKAEGLRPTTLATYQQIAKHRIFAFPAIHDLPVDQLTTLHVSQWWADVVAKYPTTGDRNKRAYENLRGRYRACRQIRIYRTQSR